jgi:hypothetical protein
VAVSIERCPSPSQAKVTAALFDSRTASDLTVTASGTVLEYEQEHPAALSYSALLDVPCVPGDLLQVQVSHARHGEVSFEIQFADSPTDVSFTPTLKDWVGRVVNADDSDDALQIDWTGTEYSNTGRAHVYGVSIRPDSYIGRPSPKYAPVR